MKLRYLLLSATILGATSVHAQFSLAEATGLIAPSFRGDSDTTWFGWASGTFDGANNNERVDDPTPTIGTTTTGVSFTQPSPYENSDILASSNNIYTGVMQNSQTAALTLVIPTDGIASTGYTTIIIQGVTNTAGSFAQAEALIQNRPQFGTLGGFAPVQTVFGVNANNTGQWWIKYEITGNAAAYSLNIGLPGGLATNGFTPISIAGMSVDTAWSSTGFATDTAAVPEPSTYAMLAFASAGFAFWAYRRRKAASAA